MYNHGSNNNKPNSYDEAYEALSTPPIIAPV